MDIQRIVGDILMEFKDSDLSELEIETNDFHLRLGRGINPGTASRINETPAEAAGGNTEHGNTAVEEEPDREMIRAPLVGTFYTAPSPDAPPFVTEGQRVKKGETLCILEAMKMMNELNAPYDLVVRTVLGTNGEMAEYNQALFEVEKC